MIDKDSHIINRVLDGDMDSFRTLMDSYSQRVFALVVRIVDNEADAEEITQDVFLKVYKNLARFDGRSMFSSWLYRIAYNESISHTRKGRREVAVEESLLRAVARLMPCLIPETRVLRLCRKLLTAWVRRKGP